MTNRIYDSIKIKEQLKILNDLFLGFSDKIFLVGGTARDFILSRNSSDIDILAVIPEELILALGFRQVAPKTTPNIFFRHDPKIGNIEVTTLASPDEIESNLNNRDFTINAILISLEGAFIDPLNGQKAISERLLFPCSQNSFKADPLRIFRLFRFASDGWEISPEARELALSWKAENSFAKVPSERFSREMVKALTYKYPYLFFMLMVEYGAGIEFLPELFVMPDIPAGPIQHHPEGDLFSHSLEVLKKVSNVTDDPLSRFCAFFHDLGKTATEPSLFPKHHGHEEKGFDMASPFCRRVTLPATYSTALSQVCRLHGKVNRWKELRNSTKIRFATDALKAGIAEFLPLIAEADKSGELDIKEWKAAVRIASMSSRELGIEAPFIESLTVQKRKELILSKKTEAFRKAISAEGKIQEKGSVIARTGLEN